MALGLFWKLLFSVISCSFCAQIVHGKLCTKEVVHKYTIYKMNTYTHKLIPEEKTKRNIIFVCCEGFREISRNRIQPVCEPICQHLCGGGYCYGPNKCLCNNGFQLSDQGVCERSGGNKQITKDTEFGFDKKRIFKGFGYSTTTTKTETTGTEPKQFKIIDPSTMQPSIVENDFHKTRSMPYGPSEIETMITPSSTKYTKFEVESSTMRTRKKSTLILDGTFHIKSLIPNGGSDPKITFPTSPYQQLAENESSTLRINTKSRNGLHRKLGSNSDEIEQPIEVSESSNQKSTRTPLFSKHFQRTHRFLPSPEISNDSSYSSSELTNTGLNQFPSAFESVAICTWDHCYCQPGYELFQGKLCRLCATGSKCKCREGYAFDSKAFQCKPLCNGKLDGCIRGTCIEYNYCLCDRDTEHLSGDIFRCYAKEGEVLQQRKYLKMWYLIFLLIPAGLAAFLFCTLIKRRRSARTNRLKAQSRVFQEIRYFNTSSDEPSLKKKYQGADNENTIDDPLFNIQRNANVVVVTI